MDRPMTNPLPLLVIGGMILLVAWAAILPENVPPLGRVLDEAHILQHGTELDNALFEVDGGSCVRTYRRPDCRRWIDLVGRPSSAFLYGIVRTTVGDVVTGYYAPTVYWERKVQGWELAQSTGYCGP